MTEHSDHQRYLDLLTAARQQLADLRADPPTRPNLRFHHTILAARRKIHIAHTRLHALGIAVEPHPDDTDAPDQPTVAQKLLDMLPAYDGCPIPPTRPLEQPHAVPIAPPTDIIGRDELLRKIARSIKDSNTTLLLHANAPGMGTTTLAIAIAYRYGGYFAGGVFWVSCADEASQAADLIACAAALGYAPRRTLDATVTLLRRCWEDETPRLIIFDDCDSADMIAHCRPTQGASRIIITTTASRWANERGIERHAIEPLAPSASRALLRHAIPSSAATDATLDHMAERLHHVPLALALVGSSHADSLPITKVRGCKHEISATPQQAIATTAAESLARLIPSEPIDAYARTILARALVCAPGSLIPRSLLAGNDYTQYPDTVRTRNAAIDRLIALGLCAREPGGTIRIHKMTAKMLAPHLSLLEAQADVEECLLRKMSAALEHSALTSIQQLLPHLHHIIAHDQTRDDVWAANLLGMLAAGWDLLGESARAIPFASRALAIRTARLGPNHHETVRSLNNMACLLIREGHYPAAHSALNTALTAIAENPDTPTLTRATILCNLATIACVEGRDADTHSLLVQAHQIRVDALGQDHPTAQELHQRIIGMRPMAHQ